MEYIKLLDESYDDYREVRQSMADLMSEEEKRSNHGE